MMMPQPNLMQMFQMLQGSPNPMAMMQQMFGGNPVLANAQRIAQGKSEKQLEMIVRNMAQERNIDIDAVLQQLGYRPQGL